MTPEHIFKQLEVQRYRISSQISLISHLRNDGRIDESEKECDTLNDLLEQQTRLLKELWDAQEECGLRRGLKLGAARRSQPQTGRRAGKLKATPAMKMLKIDG
jgi:hypothetical protein